MLNQLISNSLANNQQRRDKAYARKRNAMLEQIAGEVKAGKTRQEVQPNIRKYHAIKPHGLTVMEQAFAKALNKNT